MPALYVDAQGAYLRKDGGEYLVKHHGAEQRFPAAQVDRVLLFGNVQLSTQVMASLLEAGVPVFFMSSRGRLRGRLAPAIHANVRLRMCQYRCVQNEMDAVAMARWFVIGKVRNAKEFLCRRLADAGLNEASVQLRERLKRAMDSAGRTHQMERLRGIEGMAARDAFDGFGQILATTPFAWHGRNRQPPRDPANALLSLGYTLLLNESIASLESIGLDLYAGFLHGGETHSEYGKPALALDLMEEFRYLVDRLALRLLLSGGWKRTDFEKSGNGGCWLKPNARKHFFIEWEKVMNTAVKYDHRRLTYRMIVGEQAALIARALREDDVLYRPFMP